MTLCICFIKLCWYMYVRVCISRSLHTFSCSDRCSDITENKESRTKTNNVQQRVDVAFFDLLTHVDNKNFNYLL